MTDSDNFYSEKKIAHAMIDDIYSRMGVYLVVNFNLEFN